MRIKALVSYDGTAYGGWQVQKNADTVQARVEGALEKICGAHIAVTSAGRTDAGVHARAMPVHFEYNGSIPPQKLPYVFNTLLPPDIRVTYASVAPEGFHARYTAHGKRYIYSIWNAPFGNALLHNRVYHFPYRLNIEKMRQGAAYIEGKHDFAAFCAAGSSAKTTVRTVFKVDVSKSGDMVTVTVEGDGFLYNMVRIITGTLLLVGQGKLAPEDVQKIIDGKRRGEAGFTVPACGLMLDEVFYND